MHSSSPAVTTSIQGVSVASIARDVGTPVYVYDAAVLHDTVTQVAIALTDRARPAFRLQANPNVSVCAAIHTAGAVAVVGSPAELTTALLAGCDADQIVFATVDASEDVEACLRSGVGVIVAADLEQLTLIDRVATARGTRAPVGVQLDLGIDEKDLGKAAFAARFPSLDLIAVRSNRPPASLSRAVAGPDSVRHLIDTARRIDQMHPLRLVLLGDDLNPTVSSAAQSDADQLSAFLEPVGAADVLVEYGLSFTRPAGLLVARVRNATDRGDTQHVVTDIDLVTDQHQAAPVLLPDDEGRGERASLLRGPDPSGQPSPVQLPVVRPGDLLAVRHGGPVGVPMPMRQVLSRGLPAEVLVADAQPRLIRVADTTEDLLRGQRLVRSEHNPSRTGRAHPIG
ncbi:hypothetical protein [Flexivirga meconopsidis]|uniref:hypothetical protein n=1 Tax=Flexivirga meconopsidis TaxID=2977121 RepID=UPI00223F719A|nr:hypothetical protein [Flexivirga meconopsidis]